MSWLKNNFLYLLIFFITLGVFFSPVWRFNYLPIPADNIVGLYHPFRDFFSTKYPSGIPYKNFLLTDPVRQQYLWKHFAITVFKQGRLPWWNPYTFSGTPFLASLQAGVFYPLNLIFFLGNFVDIWTVFIFLQLVLGGLFFYWFCRHHQIHPAASLLGCISFIFGGFFMSWLEWGNIGHTILWLPLILLSIDKIFTPHPMSRSSGYRFRTVFPDKTSQHPDPLRRIEASLKAYGTGFTKISLKWQIIFLTSLISQFFAGHLQTSFYVITITILYLISKLLILPQEKRCHFIKLFTFYFLLFSLASAIQWLPTLQLIKLSARDLDQINILSRPDWFLPWQHLIQIIAPDFFGNPATLNYWGVWNYAEFVSYIGMIPLIFALFELFHLKISSTKIFAFLGLMALIFALPTPLAKLPFLLKFPFLSQAQPSRLLFIFTFSFSILAAYGFNRFILEKKINRQLIMALFFIIITLAALWLAVLIPHAFIPSPSIAIARRNLILPTIIFILATGLILVLPFINKLLKAKFRYCCIRFIIFCLIFITIGDLLRFANKFTPFSSREYLFPLTKTIEFLHQDKDLFRIMSVDRRILPPNFAMAYNLSTVEGYDPLYLKTYAQLITELETGERKDAPIAFNRIISPTNLNSDLVDKLNVKYVLSLNPINNAKFKLVFQEGETKVYLNQQVQPRIRLMEFYPVNKIEIIDYQPTKIVLQVITPQSNILEIADMMYPGWQAKLDGENIPLSSTNNYFRQINIPSGEHQVMIFYEFNLKP